MKKSSTQCPNCGAQNDPSALFCSKCGNKLPPANASSAKAPKPPAKNPAWVVPVTIVGLVVIAGLIYTIISLLMSGGLFDPASTPTPTATATPAETPMPVATATPLPTPTIAGIAPGQDLAAIIANAADGDTITLAPGTFTLAQGLDLTKSLTIVGAGSGATTLTTGHPAASLPAVIAFSGSGKLSLQGLALAYRGTDPAAILALTSGMLDLADCTLSGSTLSSSKKQLGAIQLSNDASGTIRDSRIEGNKNADTGDKPSNVPGGIILNGNAQLTIDGSEITDSVFWVLHLRNVETHHPKQHHQEYLLRRRCFGKCQRHRAGQHFSG